MDISEEVKRLRSEMGLNRRAFCDYFSIPYRTMVDWEAGKRKMPEYLLRLMEYKAGIEKINSGKPIISNEMMGELISGSRSIVGATLDSIVLYGSVARNEASFESDIDVALMVNEPMTDAIKTAVLEWSTDLDLKYDRVFSIIDIESQKYAEWKQALPFYKNIEKEGIVLWKSA